MIDHLRIFGIVSLVRSLLEALLGAYLLATAAIWSSAGTFAALRAVPEPGDRRVFIAAGIALLALAGARLLQSAGSLLAREWARRAGIGLALLDFITPVTLPLALWGLVIYRHPETRDHFRTYRLRRAGGAAASERAARAREAGARA